MGAKEEIIVGPEGSAWGTWEELILGGAVLRHGTRDWNVVASELRARTIYPYIFTPEACKAKYEDLREQYSGCTAWFEELRKRRVAELRRELEKSDDSIGSLESLLNRLKAEKEHYNKPEYTSSQEESPLTLPKLKGNDSSARERSKDGLSASSFTHDAQTNWSPECQVPGLVSTLEEEIKQEVSDASELEKAQSRNELETENDERARTLQKRRGKRKRRNATHNVKGGCVEESNNLGSSNVASTSECKDNLKCDFDQATGSSDRDGRSKDSSISGNKTLMEIFNTIAENGSALVFTHRLDSQKRARYKRAIRTHLDFDTLRSRIASCSIKSTKELFRDLLLLANNALVFYSKRTREYKSAFALRDLVTKCYRLHCQEVVSQPSSSAILPISPMYNRPAKPRSARPRPQPYKPKFSTKLPYTVSANSETSQECHKTSYSTDSNILQQFLAMIKKNCSQLGKVSRQAAGDQQPRTPVKERKRAVQR